MKKASVSVETLKVALLAVTHSIPTTASWAQMPDEDNARRQLALLTTAEVELREAVLSGGEVSS